MASLIGQSIGRYHILEQLGEGGMATVFKAYDTRLERDVALKVIRVDQFPPALLENILKRFEREAKALARLTHPNIVPVIDYGEHDGAPYLVMPFLPGGTLKKRLGKSMPWQEAARTLLPIVRALEFAHEHKIIHRDIKPANILLTENDQPLLSDFGIAKILEGGESNTLTGTGVGIGTPEYMAPEQWMGESGVGSDIYSLGVVLYELVTGRKPYVADTPAAILLKQANEPLPRPSQFASDLPEEVERILFKALAKRPEDRYENMSSFAAALEAPFSSFAPPVAEDRTIQAVESAPETRLKVLVESGIPAEPEPVKEPEEKPGELRGEKTTLATPPPSLPREEVAPTPAEKPVRKAGWLPWAIGAAFLVVVSVAGILIFNKPGKSPAGTAATNTRPASSEVHTPLPTPTRTPHSTSVPADTLAPAHATPTINLVGLKVGSTWVRPADGMTMMYVPEGGFLMGLNANDGYDLCLKLGDNCEKSAFLAEEPVHHVQMTTYWIDKTEVTNAMYMGCVKAGHCNEPSSPDSSTRANYTTDPAFSDYPVIYVNWDDASKYCTWAGARLPTEAEWEKAARSMDGRLYPWGGNDPDCNIANFSWTSLKPCIGDTNRVGSYPENASAYGVLDMAGNVWEWVADWFGDTYYASSPRSNPTGPETGTARVLRGGAWSSSPNLLRSSTRAATEPVSSWGGIGFRCVRNP